MSPFLVVYNRLTGEVTVERFSDAVSAMKARLKKESEVGDDVEVVVLGSESPEKLRETHSRYFNTQSQILEHSKTLLEDNKATA